MDGLAELFTPTHVGIVGASDRPNSVGRALMTNLLSDFDGDVTPTNPNYDTVLGIPCKPTITSTDRIDLAVIAVPPETALDTIQDAADAGVQNIVVITAGFSEAGGVGVDRERELKSIAQTYTLNLVGPNCLGIINTKTGLNATFAPTNARPGSISFLSQSGAVITAALDWARDRHIGFKDVVSLGNKAVLDEIDFIEVWDDDPDTDVILGYLESITDGRSFIDRVREVTKTTPVLLVKAGRTDAGAKAASSHTGAIAGSDRAYDAGLATAGVIRMNSLEDLFDAARALASLPQPESNATAIITNAGGIGVLATDAIDDGILSLASFSEPTHRALASTLPEGANRYNPVDIIGDAPASRFRDALNAILTDEHVGAVIVLSAPTQVLSYDDLATTIADCYREHDKPIVTCLLGGSRVDIAERKLNKVGIPNYLDPTRAIRSLETLVQYADIQSRSYPPIPSFDIDTAGIESVISGAAARGHNQLGVEAMDILTAIGIPIPESEIVTSPAQATAAAAAIDGPVVMKIVSPDIVHKTDIGGVKVGVPHDEVPQTYEELVSRAHSYHPTATILGVQIQQLLDTDMGVETIIGMNRDPQFGPVVLFGLGGIFVEVLEDTAVRIAPISDRDAREMVAEIDAAPLLRGARGREPVAIGAVVDTIQRVSQLAVEFPAILELDINPLLATPEGVSALDFRLTVHHQS